MGRTTSKSKVGEVLSKIVEKISGVHVVCGACGNVYKMERCLRRYANAVPALEEMVKRVGATVDVVSLVHVGYYECCGGLKRHMNRIGYHSDVEIIVDGKPVAVVTIHEYVTCDGGALTLRAKVYVSKFYDEEVKTSYCKRAPDVSCVHDCTV